METHETRVTPHDLGAERAVLGAVLLDNAVLDEISAVLTPADFYRRAHAMLYREMLLLAEQREPIDLLTLMGALSSDDLDTIGGPAYITALVDGVPHRMHAAQYAAIVRDQATLRAVLQVASAMRDRAYDPPEGGAAEVLACAQRDVFAIASRQSAGQFVSLASLCETYWPMVEQWRTRPGGVSGVPSGFVELDYLTHGFQPSDLILLAARPAMGKTCLALNMAFHAATVGEKHVGVFSLEMSESQLWLRAMASTARVDGHRLLGGHVSTDEWARLLAAITPVSQARLHIDDSPLISVADMRARARRLKAEGGLDWLVLDYVQLVRASTRSESRNVEVGEFSRDLKALAKELQIPVLAISQLSRACEARPDKHPMLSDLRDSGSLEQDADLVLFLYRDEVYHPTDENEGVAELTLAKHRNGPGGRIRLDFDRAHLRFVSA